MATKDAFIAKLRGLAREAEREAEVPFTGQFQGGDPRLFKPADHAPEGCRKAHASAARLADANEQELHELERELGELKARIADLLPDSSYEATLKQQRVALEGLTRAARERYQGAITLPADRPPVAPTAGFPGGFGEGVNNYTNQRWRRARDLVLRAAAVLEGSHDGDD